MSFSFLHPLFWIGALGVAVPLYLHLRRKQPQNLFVFSTLRFLEDSPVPRQSPLRLRDLLLLALRLIAFLLVIGAFAWPFVNSDGGIAIKESRVYILDNTLSHQVDNGFQNDRDRLAKELAGVGKNIQVAVIELTASPRVIAGFGDDHELARQKVRQLQPSFQRGSYFAAFRQANALFANSLGEKKKIVLLADSQENQWTENLNSPAFLEGVEVEVPHPLATARSNVAVSEPRAERIFLGDKSLIFYSGRLTHVGTIRSARVTLRVNGQEMLSRDVDLSDKPENITFQTEWEAAPSLQLNTELSVQADGDSLAGDNHAYFSLAPEREGKVAVLAHSSFLRLALSPEIMRGRWATRYIDPVNIAAELDANNDAEVLCIESSYLQSADARKLLWRYASNGRGVFVMVNRVSPAIKAFLRELGYEVMPSDSSKSGPAHLQYIFGNHPILHPFTSPDYGNLLEVEVTDPVRLQNSQALPLIYSEKGEPVLFQSVRQPGRILVAAFAFERAQTSWPIHPTFLPFLDLCLQNSRPVDNTPTVFEPAEVYAQNFATNSGVRALLLRDLTGKDLLRSTVSNGRAQVRMPDQPGFYSLVSEGDTQSERTIAINPPLKESQLTYTGNPQALQLWALEKPTGQAAKPTKAVATLTNIWQQRIWWWLLLAAFVGLWIESLWTSFRRRIA